MLDAELLHALPRFEWRKLCNLPGVAEAAAIVAETSGKKKKKKSYQYPPPVTEQPGPVMCMNADAEELANMGIKDLRAAFGGRATPSRRLEHRTSCVLVPQLWRPATPCTGGFREPRELQPASRLARRNVGFPCELTDC